MYFLLAVGIWIYVIYVYRRDENGQKKSRRLQNEWVARATKDHEKFFREYSASEELLSETYSEVFANSERVQHIRERIETDIAIIPTMEMLVLALLSSECKIPKDVAYSGFRTTPESRIKMQIERSFFKWYDNELRSNGFEYKLLFVSWEQKTEFKAGDTSVSIPLTDNPEVTSGIYYWEPIRMFTSGCISITV